MSFFIYIIYTDVYIWVIKFTVCCLRHTCNIPSEQAVSRSKVKPFEIKWALLATSHLRLQLRAFVFLWEAQLIILIVKIHGDYLSCWPQRKRKWWLPGIFGRELGAGQKLLWARPSPRLPPPFLCMQMHSHSAVELISIHLQLGSSRTWGDWNASYVLGDMNSKFLALPEAWCYSTEQEAAYWLRDKTRPGGGRAFSLFLSLSRHWSLSSWASAI